MPLWWPEFPGFELKKSLKNGEIAMSVGGAHRKLHSKCLWWPEFPGFELKRPLWTSSNVRGEPTGKATQIVYGGNSTNCEGLNALHGFLPPWKPVVLQTILPCLLSTNSNDTLSETIPKNILSPSYGVGGHNFFQSFLSNNFPQKCVTL